MLHATLDCVPTWLKNLARPLGQREEEKQARRDRRKQLEGARGRVVSRYNTDANFNTHAKQTPAMPGHVDIHRFLMLNDSVHDSAVKQTILYTSLLRILWDQLAWLSML